MLRDAEQAGVEKIMFDRSSALFEDIVPVVAKHLTWLMVGFQSSDTYPSSEYFEM